MAITYRQAGVDIDAADRLIERIKPLARSTRIPEVVGGVGGFAGLCGLPADIEQAVIILTTNLFRNRTRNPQIKREHVLEAAVWYQDQGFKSLIQELLDPYVYLPGS